MTILFFSMVALNVLDIIMKIFGYIYPITTPGLNLISSETNWSWYILMAEDFIGK